MQDMAVPADQLEALSAQKDRVGLYTPYGKRLFDVLIVLALLPIALPVIGVLWCLMRRDGGPGIFGHTRVGWGGKRFTCYKIRTMVVDAEAKLEEYLKENPEAAAEWARDQKLTNDPRINRFGHFLRKSSLDELPQIWNVLRGDMSFVGPRPVVAAELPKYGAHLGAYLAQKPGITGLWQVSGRNDLTYDERVDLDVEYLFRRSLGVDLMVIIRTLLVVVQKTGR